MPATWTATGGCKATSPGEACAGPAGPTNSAPATVPALIAPAATRRHELREINMISSLVKIPEIILIFGE